MRQAKEAIELSTDDEDLRFKLIQDILAYIGENFSKEMSSNATGSKIHQYIKKETGCYDPYKNEKREGNEIALSLLPKVRDLIKDDDSLETYVKIAIVGNILDFGAYTLDTDIEALIFEGLSKELVINDIDKLEEDLKKYTMRLLQLCRESLIYLVYAIGIDDSKKDKSEKVANLSVSDFPDDWKL